jgi:predicted RNA-binding protein with PIN domain
VHQSGAGLVQPTKQHCGALVRDFIRNAVGRFGADYPEAMAEPEWSELPEPLCARLSEVVSVAVGELPWTDVPQGLRRLAHFTPGKRARLGARQLLTELRRSAAFRTAVFAWWSEQRPGELAGPDADSVSVAAAAVLSGASDVGERVAEIAERTELVTLRVQRDAALAKVDKLSGELDRLRGELTEARAAIREARAARGEELDRLRKRIREQGTRVRNAEDATRAVHRELADARDGVETQLAAALVERDRAKERADAERVRASRAADQASGAQQAARQGRRADEVRLELLMETLSGALAGLRSELSMDGRHGVAGIRPADLVASASRQRPATARVPDAATLDRLLGLPAAHLIVDGYNVSKTEYPDLALFDQRTRLIGGLAVVVARTGAEVTVVFDGAAVASPGLTRYPKGVRVLFSKPGVLADDVIRDLVAAEPVGRPVVVASSDRAVADSVQRAGAHPMASSVLLDLLKRS